MVVASGLSAEGFGAPAGTAGAMGEGAAAAAGATLRAGALGTAAGAFLVGLAVTAFVAGAGDLVALVVVFLIVLMLSGRDVANPIFSVDVSR